MQYKAQLQEANIFLTLGTISVIGIIVTMFISKNYLLGAVISFMLFTLVMILYKRAKRRMEETLNQLDKLN